MLGALLALASASFFGLNSAMIRRGVIRGSVLQAMSITVPLGVPLFVGLAALFGGFEAMSRWDVGPWAWMAAAGVVHFVIGRYGNYKATQLLGGTLSAPIQQLSILVALALAFVFLGESLTIVNLAGIALVIVGPMVLVGRRKAVARQAADGKSFEPRYGPGIAWGALCALGYGTSPLFVALGIGDGGIAASVGGLLVSYTTAAVVVVAIGFAVGPRSIWATLDRETATWFSLSALFVALSQLFRYVALAVAPVSVVVPIQRLSVVFRILANAVINRDYEVLDTWVIAAIVVSVIGTVALAVETDLLLQALGLTQTGHWLATPLF